jgi:predicted hotdog family 3-hydroxylacyl-ACP dehydratase
LPTYPSIDSLLPHEFPAIVVDKVLDCKDKVIVCERTVKEMEHYGPGLSPEGIMEFCAQSALCHCCLTSAQDAQGPRPGVIAALDDFSFTMQPVAGDVLQARITVQASLGTMSIFECIVTTEGNKVAHGIVKAALLS